MGKRVEVVGTSREDMNGQRGQVTDVHLVCNAEGERDWSQSRYTVQFDRGSSFKLKMHNVRAAGVAAQAGPLIDKRVVLQDGRRGVATDWVLIDPSQFAAPNATHSQPMHFVSWEAAAPVVTAYLPSPPRSTASHSTLENTFKSSRTYLSFSTR